MPGYGLLPPPYNRRYVMGKRIGGIGLWAAVLFVAAGILGCQSNVNEPVSATSNEGGLDDFPYGYVYGWVYDLGGSGVIEDALVIVGPESGEPLGYDYTNGDGYYIIRIGSEWQEYHGESLEVMASAAGYQSQTKYIDPYEFYESYLRTFPLVAE
jgi:hypothetical protein